ncbi:MAG: NAD(P)H-dependent oxidoreductase subunit E [Deltaproteobacteria bacterium]|nr:NAD(P)H-dependent oxidoreductase subunit E [Deltaproteobacteria bacterium]
MNENLEAVIREICQKYANDSARMMDIVRDVQASMGGVSKVAMKAIAAAVGVAQVEVESVVSFYAHLSSESKGKVVIRLCNDFIDRMFGANRVAETFEKEFGIKFGETTDDGLVSLEYTPCIGMCDQPPAALINDRIVTWLSTDMASRIAKAIKEEGNIDKLNLPNGDGNNSHPLVNSMVHNNLREKGDMIFANFVPGAALKNAIAETPVECIKNVKASRLRGRGGAGFPTGMKWEFTRGADGDEKYVLCNADEGEPGTFKDRVILTEAPELMFEGMTVAGYAIGAQSGVVYLRGEYQYLTDFLNDVLQKRRDAGLLGKNILGKEGFNFDIRIQMGAGAYICGEETALISSCEGLRGDPKNRPPFPAQKGYLGKPTSVNNVETFCAVAKIMEKGAPWFAQKGSTGSAGLKLFSVSGDCKKPGVYELPFGTTVKELLQKVGAEDAIAVQVGGACGITVAPNDFDKEICYDHLATGGSVMVFGPGRDLLELAHSFMEFFEEESCGYCTPCRVGNTLLKRRLEYIIEGKGTPEDLIYMETLGNTIKHTSRCGLGQTSANPVLTTLQNFRSLYESKVKPSVDGLQPSFSLDKAVGLSEEIVGRKSIHHHD